MTTRNCLGAPAALLVLLCAGCATPGPLHIYTAAPTPAAPLRDLARDTATVAEIPAFVADTETLVGFAYDPFTDHFFLRLAPGDRFRVIDRPARAIKRDFTLPALALAPGGGGGDLAIRPADGHVFAPHPAQPAVVEFNRFGRILRTLPLATLTAPPSALAFDTARDRLLALGGGDLPRVTVHDLAGQRLAAFALDGAVTLTALAYDSAHRELYAPLAHEPAVGIFNDQGHLVRTLPLPPAAPAPFLDVGPRSFLRLF